MDRVIKKYNELIKISIETMMIFKKGNYAHKKEEIENCKRDIRFFKEMKKQITETPLIKKQQ